MLTTHLPELYPDQKPAPLPDESSVHSAAMEALLSDLLWAQLHAMGGFAKEQLADLKTTLGLLPLYDRWIDESISVLSRLGKLRIAGESIAVTEPQPADSLWQAWDRKKRDWSDVPGMKAQMDLAESTLRTLPDILTGKTPATDILFPDSSMERVERIYKDNPSADLFNHQLADIA
ncbi:MAG: hypothetical protein GY862_05555, partial [Gammaproteobacteria bacterium]|nr:hypothetical protein [Gammaproteobacteria bacterium]